MVSKEDVLNAIKVVPDPHMGVSIVDMGLIKDVVVDDEGNVEFTLTPTNPGCMSVIHMAAGAKNAVLELDGVKTVKATVKGHMMEDDINKILNEETE
ncbi:metal-sulfur cluster assembly factor [Methanococcus voltae]|uniref:Metal-sulfur cluster biosynthetic enzyme n=2 Tax=Methanococcus voltae TaxID=2188 RepID=A0A8J7UTK8_METVO|nr:metal-sulfur cluster assembly factor [Methanococcus voltae]MBP2172801.1 metal-sulfur cluster biosynthetic enzyme [Methanococcus voltae]MBP2201789.1 metal-sulfur cluster biosynthetic enzyme [Methanococcus voltae]MCS3922613.1 metal-sulfur cluster biosynthetic enzyme [Methanococcus voltae PS]